MTLGGETSYAAAYRLLSQLRPVARQLSVGLDQTTIAASLLESLRDAAAYERGAVLMHSGGSRLMPLASCGDPKPWRVAVDDDSMFADAWVTQRVRRRSRRHDGGPGSALVIPLTIGPRTVGLVGLDTSRTEGFTATDDLLAQSVSEAAMRLDTAVLFDELRTLATTEERRRLAREIHDGIAQELTGFGYALDDLIADASRPDVSDRLAALRQDMSRLVHELRLSIFGLRSEVDAHVGLGAALSDYVRSVGKQSGLTTHMSLSEATTRLPAADEAELLHIAQEAITNARRHAGADNLWVTLAIDPPTAVLRVEDDGRGLGPPREDSFGLAIMQERAQRLRSSLVVRPREPRGTTVEVQLPVPGAGRNTT